MGDVFVGWAYLNKRAKEMAGAANPVGGCEQTGVGFPPTSGGRSGTTESVNGVHGLRKLEAPLNQTLQYVGHINRRVS